MESHDPKLFEQSLLQEFPPPSYEEWKKAVEETLKGTDFDKAMLTRTYEGIDLQPIYTREDTKDLPHMQAMPGQAPFVRGRTACGYKCNGWVIAQQVTANKPEETNSILLHDLNRGLNGVNILLHQATRMGFNPYAPVLNGKGLVLGSLADMETALRDVELNSVPLFIEAGEAAMPVLAAVAAYAKKSGMGVSELHGCIGFDPIGILLSTGSLQLKQETAWQTMQQMAFWSAEKAPMMRTILIDARPYAHAGGSAVQELGYALATADEYIRHMLDKGMSIDEISNSMQLNVAIGTQFFMEFAKLRAARLLFAELFKAYGASEECRSIWIHGVTSEYYMTVFDPYVNMLRTTTEGFSGVMGGVDSLQIIPFDANLRAEGEFSRRIARNQQIILQEEAHFDQVIDAVGGCYYVETLTAQLAEAGWKLMQEVYTEGGMLKAVMAGNVQKAISKINEQKQGNADKRKDVYVGINMYANPTEPPLADEEHNCQCWKEKAMEAVEQLRQAERPGLQASLKILAEQKENPYRLDMMLDAWIHNGTLQEIFGTAYNAFPDLEAEKLSFTTATAHLEELRKQIIAYQQDNQCVLSVFLANMGPVSQHKARADFSQGFLQVGGFYVAANDGYPDVDSVVEAAQLSQAQAVCICSTDDTYPELVPQIVSKLKTHNPSLICILAGYPTDMVETYKQQGINIFIHIRANAYDTLKELAKRMGVEA